VRRVDLDTKLLRRVVIDEIDWDERFIGTSFAIKQVDLACEQQFLVFWIKTRVQGTPHLRNLRCFTFWARNFDSFHL
jgi:hypothetical protein